MQKVAKCPDRFVLALEKHAIYLEASRKQVTHLHSFMGLDILTRIPIGV